MKIHTRQNLIDGIRQTFAEQEASGQDQRCEVSVAEIADSLGVQFGEKIHPKLSAFCTEHGWKSDYNFDRHAYIFSPKRREATL